MIQLLAKLSRVKTMMQTDEAESASEISDAHFAPFSISFGVKYGLTN